MLPIEPRRGRIEFSRPTGTNPDRVQLVQRSSSMRLHDHLVVLAGLGPLADLHPTGVTKLGTSLSTCPRPRTSRSPRISGRTKPPDQNSVQGSLGSERRMRFGVSRTTSARGQGS